MFVATTKILYCIDSSKSTQLSTICCTDHPKRKSPKCLELQSEIGNLRRLQLKLQFISDKCNKFRIRGFSFGIADRIAEKSLECIQITSVPGHFDGMADGPLHSAGGGLECFRHLGVQYLGDGIRVPDGPRRGYQEQPKNKGVLQTVYRFICWSMHRCFIGLVALL